MSVGKAAAAGLPPFVGDMAAYLVRVGKSRGREIEVCGLDTAAAGDVCGLWTPESGVDYIFVAEDLQGAHRDHTLAHELGHVVLNHVPRGVDQLFTRVNPRAPVFSGQGLGRSPFSDEQEAEAEDFATALLADAHGRQVKVIADDRIERVASVFGGLS